MEKNKTFIALPSIGSGICEQDGFLYPALANGEYDEEGNDLLCVEILDDMSQTDRETFLKHYKGEITTSRP